MDPHLKLRAVPVLFAAALGASCVTYQSAPLDPPASWAAFEGLELPTPGAESAEPLGFAPIQLAAFAVDHHPSLVRARSELGVSEALIVQAGLWPGLQVGWGASDVLAAEIAENNAKTVDYLSGFDLMFELPRPGELDAKEEAARWRAAAVRANLLEAEWRLARDVLAACVELSTAQRLLAATSDLAEITNKTAKYFTDAAEAGTATATEASLAMGDAVELRVDMNELTARVEAAHRTLNGRLGLRPSYELKLAPPESWKLPGLERPLEGLQDDALELRPELIAARALHEASEADLRLEIARQFPLLAVGTGISIRPGLFSHFNRPAIETAQRRREVAEREFTARLFGIRAEVFDSVERFRAATELRSMIESELLVNAQHSLDAVKDSFESGEVTLVETLNVQRAMIAARTRLEEARALELGAAMRLATVTGRLAGPDTQPTNN